MTATLRRDNTQTSPPPGTGVAQGGALPYLAQLDAVRAIAILFVLIGHWFLGEHYFPFAPTGVRLFFVLSGFLITGILLECRETVERGLESRGFQLRQFYIRRAAHILPLYYLVVFIAAAINLHGVREGFWRHFFYLSNVDLILRQKDQSALVHFWSLAVEEQFYLFWPWIILFAPRRLLPWIVGLTAISAPIFRIVAMAAGVSETAVTALPFGCLDSLGLGAFLAVLSEAPGKKVQIPCRVGRVALLVGLLLLAAFLILRRARPHGILSVTTFDTAIALCSTWLVGAAATGFGGVAGAIFTWRPLLYTGRISYGLYVYHAFMPGLVNQMYRFEWFRPPHAVYMATLIPLAFVIATLSWFAFERPLNQFKRRFPYERSRK